MYKVEKECEVSHFCNFLFELFNIYMYQAIEKDFLGGKGTWEEDCIIKFQAPLGEYNTFMESCGENLCNSFFVFPLG
jgi:hypothetical protein